MMDDRCLPVLKRDSDGHWHYCVYWDNFCEHTNQHFITRTRNKILEQVWNGRYCSVRHVGDMDYVEFKTPKDLTLFLLRWS
jgi:hypothetical protein